MKNKILVLLFAVILVGCSKADNINKDTFEEFMVGYTLDDGRVLNTSYNPVVKNETTLGDSIFNGDITLKELTNNLLLEFTLKDGGSSLYKYDPVKGIYGNIQFYVMICNSLDGIKDIYISKSKENIIDYCRIHVNDLDNVEMSIKEGSLSNNGLTLIIKDTSKRNNIYGNDYYIEEFTNNRWNKVKTKNDLIFTSIGYRINGTKEFKINFEYNYGTLKKGHYRIIKSTGKSGEAIRHYLTAEFDV